MKLPKRVTIELTNDCNRRCVECPRHKTKMQIGYMTQELFKSIIMQIPLRTVIVPFFRGEPLLHPKFAEFMYKLNMFNTIQLASNGDFLTRNNQKAILDSITFFSLSLHDTYPTQRQIQFLKDCRKAGVQTQISTVGKPSNLPDLIGLADRIRVYKRHSIDGIADMQDCPATTSCCDKPFKEMIIYWDGKVGLCNHDWMNHTSLGNLNEQSIFEVYNSMEYEEVRQLHKTERRCEVPACRNCSFESHKIYGEIIDG